MPDTTRSSAIQCPEDLRAAHPGRRIDFHVSGNCRGTWDGLRLQQLLGNLVVNAIKYGAPDAPVTVVLAGEDTALCFEVKNVGPTLDPAQLELMFEPLRRGQEQENESGSLGLGLFIAREIVNAHGGDIKVSSGDGTTVFAVHLPRVRSC